MIQTLIIFEWKQFVRNKSMVLALLVFFVLGLFCLHQGKTTYVFQQTAIDSALVKEARNFKQVKEFFDTLRHVGSEVHELETPFSLDYRLQDVVVRRQNPLSILSTGQSDVYPPLLSGRFNVDIFKNSYAEFQNPEKLLTGNLDVAYFMLFLFPLLFLAFSYNVQSADKESGISSLLTVQANSVRKIYYQRLLIRWLLALLPFIAVGILSYFLLSSFPFFNMGQWIQWWSVAFVYALFWLFLVGAVLLFQFSSLINAIVMAGSWVLLLIAVPGLLNTWFSYKYPPANKTEIAEYRDFDFKAWELPFDEHRKYLLKEYPAFKDLRLVTTADSVKFRSFSYVLMVREQERALYQQLSATKKAQSAAEKNTFWLNPIGGIMHSFVQISQVSFEDQQAFEESVLDYRLKKAKYFFEISLTLPHFGKKEFANIPTYKDAKSPSSFIGHIFPLISFMIVLLTFLFLKIK